MEKFIYLLVLLFIGSANGFKCYVCTMSESETSDACATSPESVSTGASSIECPHKYCTIKRLEYKNPAGRIASFYRGCESNPVYLNTMIEDEDFKTYYRSCTRNLCNIGNGIQSVTNIPGSGGKGTLNLIVDGIGYKSAASSIKLSSHLFLIISTFITIYYALIF